MDAVTESHLPIALAPRALIEVLDTHGRVHSHYRLETVGASCRVGRSVLCDIVLDDPYAAAEHTVLSLQADGRLAINDLGSKNGTRVDGRLVDRASACEITEGELIIGRTRVRIRTALTELQPERVFRRDVLQRYRTSLAVTGLTLCIAYVVFAQWVAFPEPMAPRILTAVVAFLAAIGVWTGIWAIVARVSHGAWALRTHTAIATNLIALCLWSGWLLDVATFATQIAWIGKTTALIVATAILAALILHLRKATHLSLRAAGIIAIGLPIAFGGAAAWVGQQSTANDVNRIDAGAAVYPPQLRIAASVELSDYLAGIESLKREANRKRRASLAERPLAASE